LFGDAFPEDDPFPDSVSVAADEVEGSLALTT
jgi:hypothetical protein